MAYAISVQTTFPGWGYWIEQGASTLWESWNGNDSRNHHMFSDISAWFYKGLAGINPDPAAPGFKHVILRPGFVKGLRWINASHESMYGTIGCNWKVNGDEDKLILNVSIPVNCTATLYLSRVFGKEAKKAVFQ